MPDNDLMVLGFGFENKEAITGITQLQQNLNSLDAVHGRIKSKFEEGFGLGNSAGSITAFSDLIRSISTHGKSINDLSSGFKNISAVIPKLTGEKIQPISEDAVAKMQEFSLAGTAAGNSLNSLFDGSFVRRMREGRKELGSFNSALLHVSRNAREAKAQLAGIPGMLNRLSGEKVKVITPEAIESIRLYGEEVKKAASEVKTLQNFTGKIRKTSSGVSSFDSVAGSAAGSVRSLGNELLNIATMTSLPMFFRNAAREAVNFGAELAQIESLTLNFSADKLRSGLLALPSAFGDARKNANALYYAYSSGVEGSEKELVDFTAQISKLSQVIRANQTDTVNAVTSAFNAYNLSVRDAAEVSDLFYAIVKRGKAEGNQLATGLGQVIPTAATAGLTLNEMGAAITSLTKVMQTRNAITYFNNAISKLIKPTKESRLEAKKLGIELGLDALRAKGFSKMMEELRQKTLGNQEALLKIFPDLRGQRAALQLLNKGWGDFQSQLDFFNKKAGVTDAAFEKLNESIEYQLSILPQTFNKIKIAAGEVMTSILTLGGALEPVLRAFNNMGVTGQRVVGALTLMGAAYGLLRAKTFLFNTVQGVEIRHQQILSALRTKEVAERSAVTAAVVAETRAKANFAKANFGSYFGKKGFGGGFSAGGGLNALANLFTLSAGGSWKRTLVTFRRTLFTFGKMVGSAVGLVAKVFSPLSLMISGSIGIVAGLIDYANAGFDVSKTVMVKRAGEAIYNFFTNAITEAERLSQFLDNKKDAKLLAQSMGDLGKQLTLPYTLAADNAESFATQIQILEQNRKKAFSNLKSESMSKNIREYNDIQKQIAAYGDINVFNLTKAINTANEKLKKEFGNIKEITFDDIRYYRIMGDVREGGKTSHTAAARLKAIREITTTARDEGKAITEKSLQYIELQKKAQELGDKIRPAIETARRAGESEISFYSRQMAMFESIGAMIESQRFSMMKPAEQMKKQQEYIKDYEKSLAVAAASGNGENASKAVKNIIDTYKSMLKNIDTSLKELGRFGENLASDGVDFLIKAASSTADKVKIFNNRAQELFSQSKVRYNGKGLTFDTALSNAELEKSYGKLKSAVSMQINAVQAEIESKRKLADAEKRANENTLKLIQSFDKFKSTAVEAVDAFSVDAIKLQSRTFDTLPAFTPQTSAQSGLQAQQQKLNDLYTKMADIAQKFADVVKMRTTATESQQTNLTAQIEAFMQKQEQAAEKSRQEQIKKMDEILKTGKDIAGKFASLTESSRQTANNTRTTANNMNILAFN